MKTILNISFTGLIIISLSGCSDKHKDNDGHNHNDKAPTNSEKRETENESSSITTLTPEQIRSVGITIGNIENKNLTATIKANGALRVPNNNKANATSLYGGVVKTLKVQLGDYVRKGQVIATIENPQFIQLQEEYLTIGNRIELAEQETRRQRELSEGNAGALKNLQNATAELNTLRTRSASLQKQIELMGINPTTVSISNLRSALVVPSPVSGTISNEFAKIGSYIDVSSPVVEIVDNSLLHLDLQVFERDLPFIKTGQTVYFTLTNNPKVIYSARVFNIGSSFENESKTVAVHCTVTGSKTGLIDGMNITGMISIEDVTTPAVPDDAIVEADGKFYIFVQMGKVNANEENGDVQGRRENENRLHDIEKKHQHIPGEKRGQPTKNEKKQPSFSFEKIEVVKGVSELGYTAITPVRELPLQVKIVTKGAFFINAKLSNTGGHEH